MQVHVPISKSERFKPHYNSAIGRYFYTKDDYLTAVKDLGLEPSKNLKVKEIKSKPYKPSPWARAMVNTVKYAARDSQGRPQLGSRFWKSLRDVQGSRPLKDLPADMKEDIYRSIQKGAN